MNFRFQGFILTALYWMVMTARAAAPDVTNVRASQNPGGMIFTILYDVRDSDSDRLYVKVEVSVNGGASYDFPASHFSGSGYGNKVSPGKNRIITWDGAADLCESGANQVRFKVTASDNPCDGDPNPGSAFALIPAGTFQMGDTIGDGGSNELPVHSVFVSAFYMERNEVSFALWSQVRTWGVAHGYVMNAGQGKAADHPVLNVQWWDAAKWCNARSEMEGLKPRIYIDAEKTQVYRTYPLSSNFWVDWEGCGYRLPTEAEWEKAARGGAIGQRFPWGAIISFSVANYYSDWGDYGLEKTYIYDNGTFVFAGRKGYHPLYYDNTSPYTSPVGSFSSNGYGLFDVSGNVWEWCWDWLSPSYSGAGSFDPHGPGFGSFRVARGGDITGGARGNRCSARGGFGPMYQNFGGPYVGFRCVR